MHDDWRAPGVIVILGIVTTGIVAGAIAVLHSSGATVVGFVVAFGALATIIASLFVKAVAQSQREAERLVEQRTAELQTLIDRAPDPTIVVDRDGTILSASGRVRDLLGFEPDELVGRGVEELVPIELREIHTKHRAGYLTGQPTAREMGPDRELTVVHRDGQEIAVEISLNPLPADEHGHVHEVVVALRDATLRRQARQHLEESISQKAAFLRTVSHELRTPLTAIAGFTDLLENSWESFDDRTRREFLARIGRNAVGLHTLIEEILAFSRLERGQITVIPEPLNLAATARDVVAQLGAVLEGRHVVVDAPQYVAAYADPQATVRILTNVLVNAVRYSPADTTVTVTVKAADPAVIMVDDQGPGIPEHERELVFEEFWRGNHSHVIRQTGTGIGLAVVTELTGLLGGEVKAMDAPGGGARIVIALPAAAPPRAGD